MAQSKILKEHTFLKIRMIIYLIFAYVHLIHRLYGENLIISISPFFTYVYDHLAWRRMPVVMFRHVKKGSDQLHYMLHIKNVMYTCLSSLSL